MPFTARHDAIIAKRVSFSYWRIVGLTALFSAAVFAMILLYLSVGNRAVDIRLVNVAVAHTSVILIGLSLALSGLCYFFDFVDTKIVYRKHLGLAGFVLALTHGLVSAFGLPRFYPFPSYFVAPENVLSFIAALVALAILSFMALVSNQYALHELGSAAWRTILRSGYLALLLVMVHFGLKAYPSWMQWLLGDGLLPPLSLLVIIFGLFVFGLRGLLWWDVRRKSR